MRSGAQTAHCAAVFIFIKAEVLGFSPGLDGGAVGGYTCLTVKLCICACLCGYAVYLSEGREGDERESELCMDMKVMSSAPLPLTHFLEGAGFPTDTERVLFFPSFPVRSVQTVMSPLF